MLEQDYRTPGRYVSPAQELRTTRFSRPKRLTWAELVRWCSRYHETLRRNWTYGPMARQHRFWIAGRRLSVADVVGIGVEQEAVPIMTAHGLYHRDAEPEILMGRTYTLRVRLTGQTGELTYRSRGPYLEDAVLIQARPEGYRHIARPYTNGHDEAGGDRSLS